MRTPGRFALLTPVLAKNDAVGNDMIGMYEALRESGAEASLFCESTDITALPVSNWRKLAAACEDPGTCIIYHYSVGWGDALDLIERAAGPKIVKYHNVTPPEFFAPYCAKYETACRIGREELSRVARMEFDLWIGASAYNAGELIAAGAPVARTRVIPPFHHVSDLATVDADVELLHRLADGFNVLMVGRVVPNKAHPDLVRVFGEFHRAHRADARLVIIGRHDGNLRGYDADIWAAICEQGVQDRVLMLGGVSLRALKAAYLSADAFLTMSRHEGFCVPVVEAMSMGVPVVALGAAAVPETVGDAGIVWKEPDPLYFAESLGELAADRELQIFVGDLGRRRYESRFRQEHIRAAFLAEVAALGAAAGAHADAGT